MKTILLAYKTQKNTVIILAIMALISYISQLNDGLINFYLPYEYPLALIFLLSIPVFLKNQAAWQKKIHKSKRLKKISTIIKWLFLIGLILFLIPDFSSAFKLKTSFLNAYNTFITNTALKTYFEMGIWISGGITFWLHKKSTIKNPKVNKHGNKIFYACLFAILILFFAIKVPYLNNSLVETANYDKFKTYIPNVVQAYMNNNIFHNENNYYTTLERYDQVPYSSFPFHTLLLYGFLGLTDKISLIVIIRIFMSLFDAAILVFFAFVMKKVFSKTVSLGTTLLLALNSFFNIYFFTTIMDRPALLLFLIACLLFYHNKKNWAYLLSGFSCLMKVSFFLINIPFFTVLILTLKKEKSVELASLGILIFLPYMVFKMFLEKTPFFPIPIQIALVLGAAISIYVGFHLLNKKRQFLSAIISHKKKINKKWLISLIVALTIATTLLIQMVLTLESNFLTDPRIILHWPMYELIIKQLENFFPNNLWFLVTLSIIAISVTYNKYQQSFYFIISLLVSCLTYIIIGSKVIFFHNYYRHIFVIFIITLIGYLLFVIAKTFKKEIGILLIIFTLLTFSKQSYNIYSLAANRLSQADSTTGYNETIQYIQDKTSADERIISTSAKTHFNVILQALRSPVNIGGAAREEIKTYGFLAVMKKYNVNYLISEGEFDFKNMLHFFDTITSATEVDRGTHILYRISDKIRHRFDDRSLVDLRNELTSTKYLKNIYEAEKKYDPQQYFKLEKVIGSYYIYKIIPDNAEPSDENQIYPEPL